MKKIVMFCLSTFVLFSVAGCSNVKTKSAEENVEIKSANIDISKMSDDDMKSLRALEKNGLFVDYLKDGKGDYKASIKDGSYMIYTNGYRGIQDDMYIMHYKSYFENGPSVFVAKELEEGFDYFYIKNEGTTQFIGHPLDTRKMTEADAQITKEKLAPYKDSIEKYQNEFKNFRERIGITDYNELADLIESLSKAYDGMKEEAPVETAEEQIQRRCTSASSGSYIMLKDGEMVKCP